MSYEPLQSINFQGGIDVSAPTFSLASLNSLSDGSWNCIVSGNGYSRGFLGGTSQGANTGSRKMLHYGKTWGGIKDIGLVLGAGSFFEDIGRSRWGIGAGQASIEGVDVSGFVLSTLLQVSIPSSGTYAAPVQAGLGQPSAPEIGIINAVGDVSNPVSAKIERRRPSTGARSVASPTSAVITPTTNRVRITFPLASTGQTHWRVYFTFQGFGGTGIHYLAQYTAGVTDIPESTVAAGTVDGITRSLEFNYKDGDLIPIEASYDDYPPPAATHAIRLENVLNLAGCYVDSVSAPTTTNPGTAIAVSKVNNYESYIPTSLLFLPEQVTDTLARPIDDYGYVACENSVHAIQYVGFRGDELPPCTITTILPDIGIQYPHNWCHFRGRLLLYTAEGNLLLMTEEGEFDSDFAAPVNKIIKNWSTSSTIVGYDPKNDAIIIANGKRILMFSLSARIWRQIWLPDFSITGNVQSCVAAKRRLYITVNNAGSLTAYSFDTNTNSAPCSFVCNYQNPSGNSIAKDIYEMAVSAETGNTNAPLAIAINKNLGKSVFREISITSFDNHITTANSDFTTSLIGKKVIIFADNISGGGTYLAQARIAGFTSVSNVSLVNLDGSAFSPSITSSNLLMFVGDWIATQSFGESAEQFANFFPDVVEARSYQVCLWMKTSGETGNVLSVDLWGSQYASSRML